MASQWEVSRAHAGCALASGRMESPDVRDLGDRVLALGTVRAVGKESGVEVEMPYTVWPRLGTASSPISPTTAIERALDAAGLSE